MRRDSMLPFVLLAVAAAPSLALPVAQSTRELATDVYERDVADDVDLYARDDGALDLFERSEYEARDDEGLTELLARAVDEVLSARSGNGFGHGYQAFISGQHQQQVPVRQNTPPPAYNPGPPSRPLSPRPPPQYHGSTKVADSSKNHKMPAVRERSFDETLVARSGNGFGHGYQAFISGQHQQQVPTHHDVEHAPARHHTPPPSYTPKRPDSPRPPPQYHGQTKVADSSKNHKMPGVRERSFDDWVVDLD